MLIPFKRLIISGLNKALNISSVVEEVDNT
jgi:hypothetical protein